MKTLYLFCIVLLVSVVSAFSQSTFYSCDSREICYWNDNTKAFENCTKTDENSRFKMNKDASMIEHTTPDLSSAYYVSKFEHDDQNNVDVYDVSSDVGNKYTYIFDTKDDEVRIVGTTTDDQTYMLTFHIKATWTE